MRSSCDEQEDVRDLTMRSFAGSVLFDRAFAEGMALVEEAARYLDGRGRRESRELPRRLAMLYASESMRVTTRLMQAASWLLVQRAVREGDMRAEDAAGERYRLGSKEVCLGGFPQGADMLPGTLLDLMGRSDTLYRRIARLDTVLFEEGEASPGARAQIGLLQEAFGPLPA